MAELYIEQQYRDKSQTPNQNVITEEFISGPDVRVSFRDVTTGVEVDIEDLVSLQFSVQEQQKPIYGYASRTFDDMAVGNRIVIGQFQIPIRNGKSKQLQALVEAAKEKTEEINQAIEEANRKNKKAYTPSNYNSVRGMTE